VLAYSSASDDDGVEEDASDDAEVAKSSKTKARRASSSEASNAEEDDENTGGWGSSKRDYYNADVIETEQDALDEEDAAREIQRKQLQGMTEADFGFDETQWLDSGKADGQAEDGVEEGAVVTEILPQLQITEQMGTAERLKLLRTRYPEFELLSKEFQELHPLYHDLARAAAAAEDMVRLKSLTKKNKTDTSPDTKVPVAVIKHRALATYLAALTMYFALLTSTSDD
ncbi:something about silencing protein 10, partial [Cryomyces antarcticus]